MKILKSLSIKEFKNRFGTIEQCIAYLADKKWRLGYNCSKYQNENYSKGKKMYNPRIRIRNSILIQNLFKIENNFCSFAIAMAMAPSQKLLFY